jgi:hypothetical protein
MGYKPIESYSVIGDLHTVDLVGNTNCLADRHVPRRSFGRGRLLVSTKEIVIEPFRRNVEFRSGK